MGPLQLLQGLFNVIIFILRFVGLVLSQIPGTKHVLKHLPWHHADDFEKVPEDAWKQHSKTIAELKQEYYNTPEYQETVRRSRLTLAERAIEDNKVLTTTPFTQPHYITLTAKVNGIIVM